jgi:hypothetical protein
MNPILKILSTVVFSGIEVAFKRYYSMYRGFVVDNQDPEGYGRIKLKVPQVYGDDIYDYWAWPRNVFSGPNYGLQLIPPIKSMVWVEFEMGDPRKPVWSHGHFGKGEKPPSLKDFKVIWFKSPIKGHLLRIDEGDSNFIEIHHADGLKVRIEPTQVFIGKDITKLQPAVLGDELATQVNKEKARVDKIIDAITNAIPTAGASDGGSGLHSSMKALLGNPEPPDYSSILSNNVKID